MLSQQNKLLFLLQSSITMSLDLQCCQILTFKNASWLHWLLKLFCANIAWLPGLQICIKLDIQLQCKVNYSYYSIKGSKVPFLTLNEVCDDSNTPMSVTITDKRTFFTVLFKILIAFHLCICLILSSQSHVTVSIIKHSLISCCMFTCNAFASSVLVCMHIFTVPEANKYSYFTD